VQSCTFVWTNPHAHDDPGKVGARGQQEVSTMTNIHAIVIGDQRADFGMPIAHDSTVGRVRVPSASAVPMTDAALTWGHVGASATVVADIKGDFPGFHTWSPPS
jgi:hypothetical protein